MSAKKHVRLLRWRKANDRGDLRYLGPFSNRAFEVLGWLCIFMSIGALFLTLITNVSPKAVAAGQSLPQRILPFANRMAALLLLIAAISRIMRSNGECRQLIMTYLGLAGIVAAGSAVVFQRTAMAAINRLFMEPNLVLSLVEQIFSEYSESGFLAFNVFIDIFLCILMYYFVNAQPKRVFTGRWVLLLRAFAVLPIAYLVFCTCLKYRVVCRDVVMPFWCFPLLTVRPVTFYALFLFLAIFNKVKETKFCQNGRTIEDCRASLGTRQNSFRFSCILALALLGTALLDFILQYATAKFAFSPMAPAGIDAMAWGLQAAKSIGFGGDALVLLIAVPLVLLYSFNRIPRWRAGSILAPLLAVGLTILFLLGSARKGATGAYIVEGSIPKFHVTTVQELTQLVKKVAVVASALLRG